MKFFLDNHIDNFPCSPHRITPNVEYKFSKECRGIMRWNFKKSQTIFNGNVIFIFWFVSVAIFSRKKRPRTNGLYPTVAAFNLFLQHTNAYTYHIYTQNIYSVILELKMIKKGKQNKCTWEKKKRELNRNSDSVLICVEFEKTTQTVPSSTSSSYTSNSISIHKSNSC